MSDRILINGLEVHAHIGVPEEERARWQALRVSVEMNIGSLAEAAVTDEVARTVNYYDVSETIKAVAGRKPRRLIETLAEEIAAAVLKNYPVRKIKVRIDKFILPDAQSVAVELERRKEKKNKSGLRKTWRTRPD